MQKAAVYAVLFGSTYIYEEAVSLLKVNKSTQWNRLTVEAKYSLTLFQ